MTKASKNFKKQIGQHLKLYGVVCKIRGMSLNQTKLYIIFIELTIYRSRWILSKHRQSWGLGQSKAKLILKTESNACLSYSSYLQE